MDKKLLLEKIKKSNLHSFSFSFEGRDLQTKNMYFVSKSIFREIRNDPEIVNDKNFSKNILKLFFGGIELSKKEEYLRNIGFSKKKISDIFSKLETEDLYEKYELGLTFTPSITAKYYTGKELKLVVEFMKTLVYSKSVDNIKNALLDIDKQKIPNFTPKVVCNLLFAYNPNNFYISNNPSLDGLKENFGVDLDISTFQEYFDNIWIFETIKEEFNLKDFGQVDSLITGYGKDENTNINYWAGGHHWGENKDEDQSDEFLKKSYWKIGWDKSNEKGKPFFNLIKGVKVGDCFALKSLGGVYSLRIKAIGKVTDVSEKNEGRLGIKWLKIGEIYAGKGPRGEGAGNWFGTLVQVKRIEDIKLIFGDFVQNLGLTIISEKSSQLNTILFGPPGTGKTFKTKEKAVQFLRLKH